MNFHQLRPWIFFSFPSRNKAAKKLPFFLATDVENYDKRASNRQTFSSFSYCAMKFRDYACEGSESFHLELELNVSLLIRLA
jgi:hypothetical protein